VKSAVRNVMGITLLLWATSLWAGTHTDKYADTVNLFRNAGQSAAFFNNCYGYAVFPTIGKAAYIAGGAHGSGRVYVHGLYVGDTTVNQLSVGFQAGGQAYSQIVFFQDKRSFDEFTHGNFEFGADVNAVAITAAAGGSVGTEGAGAEASGGKKDATTLGEYYKGLAVFTIVKGGAMFQAAVAGQKFSYSPKA
jgi:lipid-binding SYLF domain-containing protein